MAGREEGEVPRALAERVPLAWVPAGPHARKAAPPCVASESTVRVWMCDGAPVAHQCAR